jgi:hypothetical protein
MKTRLKLLSMMIIIAVLSVSVIYTGCSKKSVVQTDDISKDLAAIQAVDFAKAYDPAVPGLAKPDGFTYLINRAETEASFNQKAGELRIQIDGRDIFFLIPEGAFPDDNDGSGYQIKIVGEKWSTFNGIVFFYECLPEGISFGKPVILLHPMENTDEPVENLFWYDPAAREWHVEDIEKVVSNICQFEINHFSKYAISE